MERGRALQALLRLWCKKARWEETCRGVVTPAASPVPAEKMSPLVLGYRPLGSGESCHPGGMRLGRPPGVAGRGLSEVGRTVVRW